MLEAIEVGLSIGDQDKPVDGVDILSATGLVEFENASLGDVVWAKRMDSPVQLPMPDGRLVKRRFVDYVSLGQKPVHSSGYELLFGRSYTPITNPTDFMGLWRLLILTFPPQK